MYETVVISMNYGFGGRVLIVTFAKSSAKSEKFTLKIRSVRVDNCSPLGVIFHPNPPILGHWAVIFVPRGLYINSMSDTGYLF